MSPQHAVAHQLETLEPGSGTEVLLNIYDVSHSGRVQWWNDVFEAVKMGAFHVGVEINGQEWSFCQDRGSDPDQPSIACHPPKRDPGHHYRRTHSMGRTPLSLQDIQRVLQEMSQEYTGGSYDTLSRNCCHYANDLCQRLMLGPIPEEMLRLSNLFAGSFSFVKAVVDVPASSASLPDSVASPDAEAESGHCPERGPEPAEADEWVWQSAHAEGDPVYIYPPL